MARHETATGGREATNSVIPGRFALSVGRPNLPQPHGFQWTKLTDVARMESGHTPSRGKAEYWDGDIPWIGTRDATGNHGLTINATEQYITEAGLANSSARLLPAGTVCLSRTASVGFVVTMGVDMATSQDFVNWVCGPELSSRYLHYILVGEQESVRRFAHGTTHQTMYYPEAKALHVLLPDRPEQDAIAEVLGALDDKITANSILADKASELAIAFVSNCMPSVALADLVAHMKRSLAPADFGGGLVAHYSLPAFDDGQQPQMTSPGEIKSSKFSIEQPCVLVSKLNPRFPRLWDVVTLPTELAVSSTEFMVLESACCASTVLWAILSQPSFSAELQSKVAGTSGSHQRVRPDDLLATKVIDPRSLSQEMMTQIESLGRRIALGREASATSAQMRDALLPQLMSGKIRVKDAEEMVGDVV